MPYGDTPWIRKGQFLTEDGERIAVGSPAWFAWLQTATSFCYQPDNSVDRLTARKEKRGHQFYWYGYARNAAKLHRQNGRPAQLAAGTSGRPAAWRRIRSV